MMELISIYAREYNLRKISDNFADFIFVFLLVDRHHVLVGSQIIVCSSTDGFEINIESSQSYHQLIHD